MTKTIQVSAIFSNATMTQFLKHMFIDPHFQKNVQEIMGQTNIEVGTWDIVEQQKQQQQQSQQSNEKSKSIKRDITFEAPVYAPTTVQKFLHLKTVRGISTATMTVHDHSPETLEGITVMNMLSGMLKDNLVIRINWNAVQIGPDIRLNVEITCEYKKKIPVVSPLIESACASTAQKTYEVWISEAKRVFETVTTTPDDKLPAISYLIRSSSSTV